MCADDGQLYTSDTDPVSLEGLISSVVNSANAWYEVNGMILGNNEHHFNFSVNDSMHFFGVTIDKDLTFKQHMSSISKKVNNQFSVMARFGMSRFGMSTETMLRLYKAFILSHALLLLFYCLAAVLQF